MVEDEEHLATGINYNLEAGGYRVMTVADGTSALAVLETNAIDIELVILDLMLSGMSGCAVCESPRARDKHLPVLILPARTLAEDRVRGFDVGANQYLSKPFDLDEFLMGSSSARRAASATSAMAVTSDVVRCACGFRSPAITSCDRFQFIRVHPCLFVVHNSFPT